MHVLKWSTTFDAAHWLPQMPPDHPCSRLHGHTWRVEIAIRAQFLDGQGFVVDFHNVKDTVVGVVGKLDHRCINDVIPSSIWPTCEMLAQWLYEQMHKAFDTQDGNRWLQSVTVWESEHSSVTYSKE